MGKWLTPDAPSGSPVGRILFIPDSYLESVNGALELLSESYNWEKFGTQTPDQASVKMADMIGDYYVSNVETDKYGASMIVPPWKPITGNVSQTYATQSGQENGGFWLTPGLVVNEFIEFSLPLAAGTWNLSYMTAKTTLSGIVSHKLDGATIGASVDCYNGTLVQNFQSNITGFTVASDNLDHRLRFTATGKNASSGGYRILLSEIYLKRTA